MILKHLNFIKYLARNSNLKFQSGFIHSSFPDPLMALMALLIALIIIILLIKVNKFNLANFKGFLDFHQ
jgi:hypothetical protein